MKKKFLLILLGVFISYTPYLFSESVDMPFWIYKDAASPKNHYVPSGWMGDHTDIKMVFGYTIKPQSGTSSIQFTYLAEDAQEEGWSGVYFQQPTNNWGDLNSGYDLSKAESFSFYVRGEKGGEVIKEFGLGGIIGKYSDSTYLKVEGITLSKEWTKITIPIEGDLSFILGGFYWKIYKEQNPEGCIFYIDEVKYE
ncbi:MAG: hypothetical protein KAI43_05660 [Candidatus Aureabacteria bacterium]|nr:hypothetical protein [Candidatus Auribacterota bacterium]